MRGVIVTLLILVAAIVAVGGGWLLFAKSEHDRYVAVQRVNNSRSEIRLSYTIDHTSGPIAREMWAMQNINGHSVASYTAIDRRGNKATFDEQVVGYDVTFLFDRLVADGIWDLQTRPFRGSAQTLHVVEIAQVADKASGSHRFQFSDAHYIATEAGREYHIHLDPHKPVPNLLTLQSTSTADPRYEKIAQDFEDFGTPRFKATAAEARAKLLKG
ncbi:MAG TPA: hypothetical protein VGP41_08000 [Candidatus Lustribacter sp.]|nr:hypothetical protein [Candidatus Lustribacter sp.]